MRVVKPAARKSAAAKKRSAATRQDAGGKAPIAWGKTEDRRDAVFSRKRAALISQAARAFARRNFYEITMDQIANDLGVTKPTLYHYVSSKHELLYECHKRAVEFAERAVEEATLRSGTSLDRLCHFLVRFVSLLLGSEGNVAIMLYLEALQQPQQQQIFGRRERIRHYIESLIREGQNDGSMRKLDAMVTTMLVVGNLNWLNQWFREEGPISAEAIARLLAEMVSSGIASTAD